MSSGTRLRRSITSAVIPCSVASVSAAASRSGTAGPQPTSVASVPSRATRAWPIGTRYSPSGTTPFTGYRPWLSTKRTGLLVRIADLRRPFASAAVAG